MLKTYQDLKVWQVSIDLADAIYRLTSTFPADERFGLVSQMRRASVSISSNIAEGYRRVGIKERKKFVGYAYGSAAELETQFFIAKRLQFFKEDNDLGRMATSRLQHTLALINLYNRSLKDDRPD